MNRPRYAYSVPLERVWSVAWVRGVTSCLLAAGTGIWLLRHQHELFRWSAYDEMLAACGGRIDILGWIILAGGILGIVGLLLRSLTLGIVSCVIGIMWFGWIGGFLWYANFTDTPNISAMLCLFAIGEYIYRLATITAASGSFSGGDSVD